jgi:hypothetical protein
VTSTDFKVISLYAMTLNCASTIGERLVDKEMLSGQLATDGEVSRCASSLIASGRNLACRAHVIESRRFVINRPEGFIRVAVATGRFRLDRDIRACEPNVVANQDRPFDYGYRWQH